MFIDLMECCGCCRVRYAVSFSSWNVFLETNAVSVLVKRISLLIRIYVCIYQRPYKSRFQVMGFERIDSSDERSFSIGV